MLKKEVNAVARDVKVLMVDAQALLQTAATLTGEKAEEMHRQGMELLEAAVNQARDAHGYALATGKQMAGSADHYVKENPWRSIATSAGIGLLLGVILGRR
jgi:ElaB/YqjD/DUF883 family membrane-anchored ribosome-binding protein